MYTIYNNINVADDKGRACTTDMKSNAELSKKFLSVR